MNVPPVIVTQPQQVLIQQPTGRWQTDLCDCCNDCGVCFMGACCYLCLGCDVAAAMNECCLCGTSMAIRSVYRTRYGIPGSLLEDFFIVGCCSVCALCQLKRDIKKRKELGIF